MPARQYYGKACNIIASVQSGEVSMDATSKNVTISSVDLSRSFLLMSISSDDGDPNASCVSGGLTSSTNINFEIHTSSTDTLVKWQVVQCTRCSGVKVQRGTTTSNATTIDITLTPAVNTAIAFPTLYERFSGATWNENETSRVKITSTTNLQINRRDLGTAPISKWQVIEIPGSRVELAEVSFLTTDTQKDFTTALPGRGILFFSMDGFKAGLEFVDTDFPIAFHTSDTNVRFQRNATGIALTIDTYIVFNPKLLRQAATVDLGTNTTNNWTIPIPIVVSKSFSLIAGEYYSFARGPSTTTQYDYISNRTIITTPTNVQFIRYAALAGYTLSIQAVQG